MRWVQLFVVGVALIATAESPKRLPLLVVEAPESLSPVVRRIESFDRSRLATIVERIDPDEAARPIEVIVVPEESEIARSTPQWISGFTPQNGDVVVLFPARAGKYPDDGLEELLYHEVAHVLIGRAAGGREVPRWFNEGLATTIGRGWTIEDRTRFAVELLSSGPVSLDQLDAMFGEGPPAATKAYAIAGALVRDILARHGPHAAARILGRVRAGEPFLRAYAEATSTPLGTDEERFWSEQSFAYRWIPFLTSSWALWCGVTLLAIAAIIVHRRRRAARMRIWEMQELLDSSAEMREHLPHEEGEDVVN